MNISSIHCWEESYPDGLPWNIAIEPMSLATMLQRSVERHGDRDAIEYRDHPIGYAALGRAVDGFAAALMARAWVRPGTPLALYLPNSPHHVIGMFGATRAGARMVQLSPLDAERELIHKLERFRCAHCLHRNVPPLLPTALKLKAAGYIDTLIVADDGEWGAPSSPLAADS